MNTPAPNTRPPSNRSAPKAELLARYRAVLSAAWAQRHELAGPQRLADEAAFLPAALALQETPVHPAPRRWAWTLMALFVLAILWACIGEVDIVAAASGRVVVSERTKLIQPLEAAVVKAIHVREGDHVTQGQVLIELDPTSASADKASTHEQWELARSDEQRAAGLLQLLSNPERLAQVGQALEPKTATLLRSEWAELDAKRASLTAQLSRREAEIATVQAAIAKLEATLPLARQREQDYKRLVGEGFIAQHATQDKERERIEQERDLATQRARLFEAQAAQQEATQALAAMLAGARRELQDRHAQAATKRQQLQGELSKATHKEKLTQLTAPVDGTVQQLAVHSIGGVVTPAQPLMVVVPAQPQVVAEVAIANQDIGFVNAGQEAQVKLETFSYTKYGTVKATLDKVAQDAVTDEKRGSYYPALLTLHQKEMNVDGKSVPISPGMNVTAEVKTGKRRVIEYLLSPVQRAAGESLRER